MATVILIPDGVSRFQAGDREFGLDLVEASQAVNRIAAECEGKANFEHVELFKAWVLGRTGAELTPAQADWLIDFVSAEYTREKKARGPEASPPSPSSSASTPSD